MVSDFLCRKVTLLSFPQHNMELYSQKVYRGYVERPPNKYMVPSLSKTPTPLINLYPTTSDHLQVDRHGSELAIVLEGSNLWFCHKMTIGNLMIKITASLCNGNCVHYNMDKWDSTVGRLKDGEKVNITLHNHFSRPSTFKVIINKKVGYTNVVIITNCSLDYIGISGIS